MSKNSKLGSLNTKLYRDVVKGTWQDSKSGSGSFTINGSTAKGLYRQSGSRINSVDLFHDKNKNGRIDRTDPIIGYATTAITSTGGRGTWTWSATANMGDYFASNGSDAGLFYITNETEFNKIASPSSVISAKKPSSDSVTGTWKVVGSGPNIFVNANVNRTNQVFHAQAVGGKGRNITYDIFKDTNKNNFYDRSDKKVGRIFVTSLSSQAYISGSFAYTQSSGLGFTNNKNQPIAQASGTIDWFA